ncbi:cellulose binding domain-containing protein [Micromonospora sp. CPCC 205371]|nr:cellulose binding domain-containing protein [Micromonospora sp. CPCC 205371]
MVTAPPSGAAARDSHASVGVLAASAGCGRAPTMTSGTHTIQSNGTQRSFILRLPNNYDNSRPYRLIFGYHWLGGTANNVASGDYYGLGALSGNSAIFVAPQGLDNGWANTGGRDVTFTDDMVARITGDLCVDTTQLFSLGFSYGGGMSYALACARANVFRAVAIYSGGVISGCSGGTQPIGYLQAHGLSDNVLGISGARPMRDRFVGNNGCTPASPPEPAPGSGTHTSFAYSGCGAGYPVEWHVFDGGHTATPRDAGSNTAWLPDVTWRFFAQFQSNPNPTTTPPVGPTTTPPTSGGCTATYTVVGQWTGGFQAEVTIRNGSSAATSAWTATFTFGNGQRITQAWGATVTQTGTAVTARNASWNGALAAGGTATFGFLGSWTGSNPVPAATCTAT